MGRLVWTLIGVILAIVALYSVFSKRVENGKN